MWVENEADMATRKTAGPKKQQMEPLNLRVDAELQADLEAAARVLDLLARANGEDPVGLSQAIRRVMRMGNDVVFSKVGGRPQLESDWAALETTLLKRH